MLITQRERTSGSVTDRRYSWPSASRCASASVSNHRPHDRHP